MFFGSDLYKVIEINRKTKAKGFKDVKIGDELQFSVNMGRNRYGQRSSNIRIVHVRDYEEVAVWTNLQNLFFQNISAFGFAIQEKTLNIRDLEDHLEEIDKDYDTN